MSYNPAVVIHYNSQQPSINPAQPSINPAQPSINPAQLSINPAQPSINPAQPSPNPTEPPRTLQAPNKGGKSSVSELHEIAVQNGQHLEWIQESECGPAHCKLFSMKVVMGPHEATGSGRSKKIAKQVAAETLLKQFQGDPKPTTSSQVYGPQLPTTQPPNGPTSSNTTAAAPAPVTVPVDVSRNALQDNPVSKLHEVTSKYKLGFPEYEVLCADGTSSLQKFDIKVKVKGMETTGLGRSKKTAKRNAAQAMLDQLSKSNISIGPPQKRMMFVPSSSTTNNIAS